MNKLMRKATRALALAVCTTAICATQLNAQTILYSDGFAGSGGLLNGVAVAGGTGAGTLWSANSAFLDNGTINGANEGSAILPFDPVANMRYTLSADIFNSSDRWIALGFARDPLASPGGSSANDRFSNEAEGISWMLFRHVTDTTQNVQIFGGLRTQNGIADNNALFETNSIHQLKIELDTTGDGTSFMANFLIDGVSVLPSGTPTSIPVSVDTINYVGLAFDNVPAVGVVSFDNFTLTVVPEPATGALVVMGMGVLLVARRLRRKAV